MPQDFLSLNMALLDKHNPRLAEELRKAGPAMAGEEAVIETAVSGVPTMVLKGLSVHSKRDPEREAERLVESATGQGAESGAGMEAPAIVFGFGLGYAVSALAAKFPDRPIIVVEKRADVLKKALEVRDFRSLLSRSNFAFVLGAGESGSFGGEAVIKALSMFGASPGDHPPLIHNRALTSLYEDWYSEAEGKIKTWLSRTDINRATLRRFGKRWVGNLSKNLEAVRDIPGISRLEGILAGKDIPVFLAAAGPTLDRAGPLLGEIYKRCLVVAVDTSLRFLLGRGIEPDFAVSVDPQYWNFRHLDRAPSPKTRLIAESAVYPPVLRHSFGGVFLCGSFFPLGRYLEDRLDSKGDLGAGGSVATSAWDFIRVLGARRLWIAGLDLSFPELKTHFHGAVFEEKSHAESGRFAPAETWNFRVLRGGQPFWAKNRSGGKVLTDKRLSLYASWFENRFSQFPALKNYSLSDKGLELKGLESGLPDELLALPERRQEIDKLLGKVFSAVKDDFYSDEAVKNRTELHKNTVNTLVEGLKEIKNLAEDAARSAGLAVSRNKQGRLEKREQDRALKNLDTANKSITESAFKEIAGFLFPETEDWEAEIALETGDPLTRHLEFSARFYRALSEAASYNLLKLSWQKPIFLNNGRETPHKT